MASNVEVEVAKPRSEYRALIKPVNLALRISRRGIWAGVVAGRLILCPGDDIAVATFTSSSIVADHDNKEASLPAPSREGEIVWQEEKEA